MPACTTRGFASRRSPPEAAAGGLMRGAHVSAIDVQTHSVNYAVRQNIVLVQSSSERVTCIVVAASRSPATSGR